MVGLQKQPYGLARTCNLYKYQLDAVNWMRAIEVDVSEGMMEREEGGGRKGGREEERKRRREGE